MVVRKETPRQKMIGMMYLVLTAMLALNVSSEVLDAFAKVDRGLAKTNQIAMLKNNDIITSIEKAYNNNPVKVKPYLDKSSTVYSATKVLVEFIEENKKSIVRYADGDEFNLENIDNKGNRSAAALVMLNNQKAINLKDKVHEYRNKLMSMLSDAPESLKKTVQENLTLTDSKKGNRTIPWEKATFEEMPLISSVTLLSQLQSNIKNVETDVLNYLSSQIDAKSYKVTNVVASITGPTNTIKGSSVTYRIFPTAIDATQELEGEVNGKKFKLKDGVYEYNFQANNIGNQKIEGYINILSPSGSTEKKVFETILEVSSPNVVVSPTAMNVFYAGIKNPITVTAAGIQQSNIKINVIGAKAIKTVKGYNIIPTLKAGQKVKVMVAVEGKTMGTSTFRIKSVPTPTPMVGAKRGGRISIAELKANGGVVAVLENFPFEGLKYKINGLTLTTTGKGGFSNELRSNSGRFTNAQLRAILALRRGSRIIIDEISAVGPDGKNKRLPSLVFKIK